MTDTIQLSIDLLKELNRVIFNVNDFVAKYYIIIPDGMDYGEIINMVTSGYTINEIEQKMQQWVNRSRAEPYVYVRGILP